MTNLLLIFFDWMRYKIIFTMLTNYWSFIAKAYNVTNNIEKKEMKFICADRVQALHKHHSSLFYSICLTAQGMNVYIHISISNWCCYLVVSPFLSFFLQNSILCSYEINLKLNKKKTQHTKTSDLSVCIWFLCSFLSDFLLLHFFGFVFSLTSFVMCFVYFFFFLFRFFFHFILSDFYINTCCFKSESP